MKYPIDLLEFIHGSDRGRFRKFWKTQENKAKTLNFLEGLLRCFRTIGPLQVIGLWKRVASSAHTVESPYGSQHDKTYFGWETYSFLRITGRYFQPLFWESISKQFSEMDRRNLRDCDIFQDILEHELVLERIIELVAEYHFRVPRPIGQYMGDVIKADIQQGKILDYTQDDNKKDGSPCRQCAIAKAASPERFYFLNVYVADDIRLYLQGPSAEQDEQIKYLRYVRKNAREDRTYIKSLEKRLKELK